MLLSLTKGHNRMDLTDFTEIKQEKTEIDIQPATQPGLKVDTEKMSPISARTDTKSVTLLVCLWLSALSQASDHRQFVTDFSNKAERGCFLHSTMSLARCVLPPSELLDMSNHRPTDVLFSMSQSSTRHGMHWAHGLRLEDKHEGHGLRREDIQEEHTLRNKNKHKGHRIMDKDKHYVNIGHGLNGRVPELTYCTVNVATGKTVHYECWNGQWLSGKAIPKSELPHSRHRRGFWKSVWKVVTKVAKPIACLFIGCGSGGGGGSTGGTPVNQAPRITCPVIQKDFTAPEGEHEVFVTWSQATATDPEDGTLSVWQTSPGLPGTLFGEGTHTVTFETKDSRSLIHTCAVTFTVIVRRCSLPYVQASADMEVPDCQPLYNGRPIYGTECKYQCQPGHALSGVSKTKCNAQSMWEDSKPECIATNCGPPPDVPNASLDCGTGKNKYDYRSECTLVCDAGYQVQGKDHISCGVGQLWSSPGLCKDEGAPNVTCGQNIQRFAGPLRAPVNVTFQLPQASDNSGGPVIVTTDIPSGSPFSEGHTTVNVQAVDADNNLATCKFIVSVTVKYCNPFNASSYSSFSCADGHVYGSDCTTTCDPGYYLTGNVTQTCLQNQTWSGQQPLCKRSTCSAPDLDPTGQLQYDCPHGYYQGESCSLSCSSGNPVIGPHIITCEDNGGGASGPKFVWNTNSAVPPSCTNATCPKLTIPRNGALVCSPLGNLGETCVISCDEKYMRPTSAADRYVCFKPSLTWDPDDYIPPCFGRRFPNQVSIRPDFYYTSGSCSSSSLEIKDNFLKALNGSVLWQTYCTNGSPCTIANVEVNCFSSTGRRRRSANAGNPAQFTIQISPKISLGLYTDQESHGNTRRYYDNLAMDIGDELQREVDKGLFEIPEIGTFDGFYASLSSFDCQPGTFLDYSTLSCAGCGQGHIYNTSSSSCTPCPVGTYQDQEISSLCIPCPGNTFTKANRASSLEQCHDFCPPGSFSPTGDQLCDLCPKGSYQSSVGSTSCRLCPFGMSTAAEGATGEDNCQFYDMELSSKTQGPRIQLYGTTPPAVTLLTWVHLISTSPRTVLTFSLDPPAAPTAGSASLGVDGLNIFMTPSEDLQSTHIRTWYHLAAVYDNGTVSLYVDGFKLGQAKHILLMDLWRKTVTFGDSEDFRIVLSGLQMTGSVLTEMDIQHFATSCNAKLDQGSNILNVDEPVDSVVIQNSCDDTDDCQRFSCRSRGTCIDELSQFSCLCEDPWKGNTCQEGPDLCVDHQCVNGATCVSDYERMNYKCACVPPYGGNFCQDLMGCKAPELREGHDSWRCVRNESSHSQNCMIVCDQDLALLPTIDNDFECGPSTNYSWSHQTKDNPDGILPDCSVQKFPIQAILQTKVGYNNIQCNAEFSARDIHRHIERQVADIFPCLQTESCYFRTVIEATCGSTSSLDTGDMTASIYLFSSAFSGSIFQSVFHEVDFDQESSTIYTVILMVQQLTNQSDAIFNFTMQGQKFTGYFEPPKWQSTCPLGTQMDEGICLDCPAGYFSPGRGKRCLPCPVGFYQDQPAQLECRSCTYGTTTGKGAYSENLCA